MNATLVINGCIEKTEPELFGIAGILGTRVRIPGDVRLRNLEAVLQTNK